MKYVLILALVLSLPACAKAPPTLSPQATTAFYGTRVIQALDVVRDTVVAAHAQVPPVVSTATLRTIVTWHRAAITIVHTLPAGWKASVHQGLQETLTLLTPSDRTLLQPYVDLVNAVLAEVGI